MFKIKYTLESGEPAHYKYINALNPETAKDMFLSQYEETGYSPEVIKVTEVCCQKECCETENNTSDS